MLSCELAAKCPGRDPCLACNGPDEDDRASWGAIGLSVVCPIENDDAEDDDNDDDVLPV